MIKITKAQIDILEHRLSRPTQIAEDIAHGRRCNSDYPYATPGIPLTPRIVAKSAKRLMAGAHRGEIRLNFKYFNAYIDRVVLWDAVDGFDVGPREDWPGLTSQGYTGIKRAFHNLCDKLEAAGFAELDRS